jgi:CRP-like cAMP-binding protein
MRAPVEILENVPQVLSRIAYFQGMGLETLCRLSANSHVSTLRRGDVLVPQGVEDVGNVFVVLEGQIHIGLATANSSRSLRFVDAGMTLGESILLMRMPPPYQAAATRKSRVLVLDGEHWLSEVQATPGVAWEVLKHLAQRRLSAMQLLVASTRRTDLSRVAGYLVEHRPKIQTECFSFELPARKLDIAANLGMSNASFSRALQRLKQADLIHVSGAFIHVLKATALEQMAEA